VVGVVDLEEEDSEEEVFVEADFEGVLVVSAGEAADLVVCLLGELALQE
jgi:homogentisate 1,2-dioxygenase